MISLFHQYRSRPDGTYMQSDLALCLMADHLQVLILISLKMIMNSSKKGRWIIPVKKISRLNVMRGHFEKY